MATIPWLQTTLKRLVCHKHWYVDKICFLNITRTPVSHCSEKFGSTPVRSSISKKNYAIYHICQKLLIGQISFLKLDLTSFAFLFIFTQEKSVFMSGIEKYFFFRYSNFEHRSNRSFYSGVL